MKKTEQTEVVLNRCLRLLKTYEAAQYPISSQEYTSRALPEFRERLQLLAATFRKIVSLVGPAMDSTTGLGGVLVNEDGSGFTIDFSNTMFNPRAVDRQVQIDVQLFLTTEMFYHNAWRLQEMMRSKGCGLPGLCGFDAPGVRMVRNHLIQHPETPVNGVVSKRIWSRGLSRTAGPSLGGAYEGAQLAGAFTDSGLYANAAEFAERLERKMVAALRLRGIDGPEDQPDARGWS